MKLTSRVKIHLFCVLVVILSCKQQTSKDYYFKELNLEEGFKNPPPENRPRTWMHAMSSNMSKVGLTKDLEAMADAGIGGIILFNVSHFIPKGNIIFNSPKHIDMIAHAAAECERLGLSFGVHNCDGWTSSGGPWVTPEHSMKQIVHSQTIVTGGDVNVKLKTPSQVAGFYRDVAVLAYPSLKGELFDSNNFPTLKSSSKDLDLSILNDSKIDKKTTLKVDKGDTEWIEFQYNKPFTLNSMYVNFHTRVSKDPQFILRASNDGVNYKTITPLKHQRMGKIEHGVDMLFDNVTYKYFRIESPVSLNLTEINLSAVKKFNNLLARTSLFKIENHRMPDIQDTSASSTIKKGDIINLTASMDENGNLNATLPEGDWTIMRFGYTIMGAINSPASKEGKGWEVDKMSRASFRTFYEGYVRNVIDATKKVAPNALQYIEIDSYEVGGQNWTEDYEATFKEQLGYDIINYLPLYAGRYIDNKDTTDRILWDIRNFNSKLMTDNYFDYFTEMCHEDGLISYVEPYSFNAGFNELDAAKNVDITMGEFWMHQRYQAGTAVSAARIYGKNVISAESFSAQPNVNWKGHPGSLKLTGDRAWTLGINEFMFHRYAHQANTNVKPGMTMSQWGSHIDRTQTWWDNAGKAWFQYLTRGQFMLRQGISVSRVLTFVGDGSPNSIVSRGALKLPNHINFDCVNTDALLHRVTVKNNKMVFPDGLTYDVLYLYNTKEIHLSTLKKIKELSKQGVVIIGKKPEVIGGFKVTNEDKIEFNNLVDEIWNTQSTYPKITDWDALFEKHEIPVDLYIEKGEDINYIHRKTDHENIYFFFNPDLKTKERTYRCTFNVDGKIPELWNQMTGEITKISAFEHKKGKTIVDITLPKEGSIFVMFRESSKGVNTIKPHSIATYTNLKTALADDNKLQFEISKNGTYSYQLKDAKTKTISVANLPDDLDISNNWNVSFPDMKSPENNFKFPKLIDWTTHENEGVKHYSGTATYTKNFKISKSMLSKNNKMVLDLGEVNIAAEVIINGEHLDVLWKAPYNVDITSAIKEGENKIEIEITNQWTNRLIGDENFLNVSGYDISMDNMPDWYINNEPAPLGKRSTFTTFPFYKKGDETIPAGMIGPIVISTSRIIKGYN